MDVNLASKSLGECLKAISSIGYTTYQNICTGQAIQVPWGGLDWLILIFIGGLVLGFLGMLLMMGISIITD